MMWNGFGMGGMWLVWLWGVLVLAGIAFLVVVTAADLRGRTRGQQRPDQPARNFRDLLDERYARGELTSEEYCERIQTLAGGSR